MTYRVLISCVNDKTGKSYDPGDVIRDGDFPAAVIRGWLKQEPPVLAAEDGDD